MADIVIKVKTEGGEESLKNINDLKNAISSLEEDASKMDLGSEAFENSKNQIDELKKKLESLSKSQKKLDEEIGKSAEEAASKRAARMERVGNNLQKFAAGLTDAFAGAFIAMGAGEEDAKRMNETLQQGVGIAIGAKGAIEALVAGVELAGPAFEALNAIMAANPIGAVVVAVAALTAGIYLLVKAFEEEEKSSNAVNEALSRNLKAHQDNEKELKKLALEKQLRNKQISQEEFNAAMGDISLQDKRLKNAQETSQAIIKLYKDFGYEVGKEVKLRQQREDYYTREGVLVRDNAWFQEKKNFDKFNSELAIIKKSALDREFEDRKVNNEKVSAQNDEFHIKEKEANIKSSNDKSAKKAEQDAKRLKESQDQAEYTRKQMADVNKLIAADAKQIEDDRNKESLKSLEDTVNKQSEIKRKADEEDFKREGDRLQKHAEMVNAVNILSNAVTDGFTRMNTASGDLGAAITANLLNAFNTLADKSASTTEKITSGLNAINGILSAISAYNTQQLEQDTKDRQAILDTQVTALNDARDLELEKEGLTAEQKKAINYKYAMQEYELKLQEYNKNTEVKKKAFEQDKKLKIAQTIISTITGVVSAVTGMISAVPGPVGIVLGALAGVAVAAMGAIQVAAISKQKFDAGSPPTAPKLTPPSADTSAIGGSNAQAGPELYRAGQGDINTGAGGPNGQRQGQPQKVYVVSQEVTSSQNMNAVLERRSSF